MGGLTTEKDATPTWLNKKFLTKTMSWNETKYSVTDIHVEAAVPKGDNFLSTIYRIVTKYNGGNDINEGNNLFLIVKTLPVGEMIQKLLSESKGFEKELHIYGSTFPTMYAIMKERSANKIVRPLSARCFPSTRPNTIVLEDLKHLGYKMANRHKGLDLDHCKMTVRALARLHAASVAMYNADPTSMDMFGEGFFVDEKDKREQMSIHFDKNIVTLASEVEKWPGYQHYADKIRAMIPKVLDCMIESVRPKENSLNVLNHGDCWVNNMMFRYNPSTGKVEDMRFVDFQIARFSSPALDLQYFLCSSTNDEIRLKETDYLLGEYHEEFSNIMKTLGQDPKQFTLRQLKEEFEEKEMFGFITCCTTLSIVLAPKGEAPDFDNVTEDDIKSGKANPMGNVFSCSRFKEVFQMMLPYYESKGVL